MHVVQSEIATHTRSLSLTHGSVSNSSSYYGNYSNPQGWSPVRSKVTAKPKIFTNPPDKVPISANSIKTMYNPVMATSERIANSGNRLQSNLFFTLIANLWSLSCLTRAEQIVGFSGMDDVKERVETSLTGIHVPIVHVTASQSLVRSIDLSTKRETSYTVTITSIFSSKITVPPEFSRNLSVVPLVSSKKEGMCTPRGSSASNFTATPSVSIAIKPSDENLKSTVLVTDGVNHTSTVISITHETATVTQTVKTVKTDSEVTSKTTAIFTGPQMGDPPNAGTVLLAGLGFEIIVVVIASFVLVIG